MMEKNNFVKFLDDKFLISERGGSIKGEFFGGLTTFLTISYIIFVNPAVLSLTGMDKGALVTVTCVATAIGSFLGGILGNVPIIKCLFHIYFSKGKWNSLARCFRSSFLFRGILSDTGNLWS